MQFLGAIQAWAGFLALAGVIAVAGSRLSLYGDVIAERTPGSPGAGSV